MKKPWRAGAIGALALMTFMFTGCKHAPELSKDNALSLVQTQYNSRPAEGMVLTVEEMGLRKGLNAQYWKLTKVYPNQRWADYTLTDEGKKYIALNSGGEVIEWRPDATGKAHFFITMKSQNHPRAKDMEDPHDDVVANVDKAKSAKFTESVDWTGVPQPLEDIAHMAGNQVSSKRTAEFALVNGAWTVHAIN